MIRKHRADTVRIILRELGQKTLATVEPTKEDVRDAVGLMKRAVEQGQVRWAEKVRKFEAWLAKQDQDDRVFRARTHPSNCFAPRGRSSFRSDASCGFASVLRAPIYYPNSLNKKVNRQQPRSFPLIKTSDLLSDLLVPTY